MARKPMKLKLKKGKVVVVVLYDEDNHNIISAYKWFITNTGYIATNIKREGKWKQIFLHRLILKEPIGKFVDHINGNQLDNQKGNLRIVTNSQNQMNRHKINAYSGLKGVYWHNINRKWFASIYLGKSVNLGYFTDKFEAAKKYNEAALKYFGKYAYLNII